MSNPPAGGSGLTILGKLFSGLLVVGLVVLGAWIAMKKSSPAPVAAGGGAGAGGNATAPTNWQATAPPAAGGGDTAAFTGADILKPTKTSVPRLDPPAAYVPNANVVDIELSQYAGYAGLIAANGGLAPNDDSVFAKKYGFKVNIRLSEEESWSALNSGKMAASATTADVLAVYGRQFQVIVPAQIGYSRGADGLVVRSDIKRVNDLKGKVVSAAQFTESDFFLRYLAREAGIGIKMLPDLSATPDADSINVVYTEDGDSAGDVFIAALKANSRALAGCVTWAPKTSEIPAASGGKAKLLVSNKNLLIIADILIVNKGFADKNPDKVTALVDGLLIGNKTVRENPDQYADLIAKSLSEKDSKWDHAKALAELQKVHLSNLPEQLAFFSGGITQGGSFASIYQSSVLAYGNDLIPNPVDSDHFTSLDALKKEDASGASKDQVVEISPLAAATAGPVESDPVLSKDIRFFFLPNDDKLDMKDNLKENLDNLNSIKRILDVSPGSHVVLVGHVDNSNIPTLRKDGGEELVQKMALEAMDLSKRRAAEIQKQLVARLQIDPKRLETVGRGWQQPASAHQSGSEPPGRSAVVHAGISAPAG